MALPAGVKSLLAGHQQAAVTVAVEGLMDAKASAEADSFITFDPKVRCRYSWHVVKCEAYPIIFGWAQVAVPFTALPSRFCLQAWQHDTHGCDALQSAAAQPSFTFWMPFLVETAWYAGHVWEG